MSSRKFRTLFVGALFLVAFSSRAGQYVELTGELAVDDWSWYFLCDKTGNYVSNGSVPSIFHTNLSFRCVVGLNTWLIEQNFGASKATYWFNGTNVVETIPAAQHVFTQTTASADGNPGRPVRVADLMSFNCPARIWWLAFCSGPCLQRQGRTIYPPSDFWKESSLAYSGWSDETTCFNDRLGLPKSLRLFGTNNQTVLRYQTRQSTNVLGWSFPLEFYLVNYLPTGTNAWETTLSAKGRLTSIRPTTIAPGAQALNFPPGTYVVRAGGPRNFVVMTNPPASNPVSIKLASLTDDEAIFQLTNPQPHAVLLWNVRVQVRSVAGGAEGFGWDTVTDDYPQGVAGRDAARCAPWATNTFRVERPEGKIWRVCVLYSTDWSDSASSYAGNYEVIGQEMAN